MVIHIITKNTHKQNNNEQNVKNNENTSRYNNAKPLEKTIT